MRKKNIVWFEEVTKDDVALVGGKGANLGEMTRAHLPIPYGFVVTAEAYYQFITASQLQKKINNALAIVNFESPSELSQASSTIQKLILAAPIPDSLINEVLHYYDHLVAKEEQYLTQGTTTVTSALKRISTLYNSPLVAVRSSATAEDLPTASFAGQQETYLNVKGDHQLIVHLKKCWASLFTERALYYRHTQGFDHFKVGLATVVQRMVQSDKSGIAFSIDPVTNDKTKMVIEAIFGLGEYIVQGKVTPDHYEVDKRSFVILNKSLAYQNVKYVKAGTKNKEVKLSKREGSLQKLTEQELTAVALLVKDIEDHYYFPQDIEWAIESGRVFIVQSRPITTMKAVSTKQSGSVLSNAIPILTGSPASPGIGIGPVVIIKSPKEIDKVKKGDILVAPQTNPDYVPAMKKAVAIITEKGGRTSHAAIVSRELGIPAIVGTERATSVLKDGEIVSVNGSSGEVFKGSILSKAHIHEMQVAKSHIAKQKFKTMTKVYVNLAEPEKAAEVAKHDTDGIGLLRAEFMIAQIGTHPKEFIKEKKEHVFVDKLTQNLLKFVKPFSPRQVVYRATDFKTNEYRHLNGGARYEPHEENPMIGYRGASRYINDPYEFFLELKAIKKIWEMGYRNLHLMIPFVRVPWELIKIKEIVRKSGLLDYPEFKLWIMVEVPNCALNIEEFLKVGIQGVSIGTNDLTMMLLGVDRDNEHVANIYDERNPMVVQILEYIVKTAVKYGVTASICGQAASDFPDIVERLVKAGITSVSVNPDAIERTRELIHGIEKKQFESLKK
ncbi:MAG: phosphoenolpyruvate synthase [Microgenomates group bacterium]